MVENAPSSVDLQDFQFKLHSKLKIFENNDDSKFKNAYNLVAAASRYGLVFVGSPNSLEVIQLKSIENSSVTKVESSSFPKRSIPLPAPSHLALNCDQTLLAVICYKGGCAIAIVYSVTSFLSQNIVLSREIRVSATPGVTVLEAGWNPTVPAVLTACKADGSLGVYNLTENGVDINELPVAAAARCFCWSPKGKQLVVGSTNGSLTQYKPDLKAVKVIPAPALGGAGPHCALSVCWVSNYQFVAVFRMGDGETRPAIVMVNAPKAGPTTYINYDDICYSCGPLRPPQYYIIQQPTWGVMLVASANSMEVGVLGVVAPGEPALWQQWNQIDAGRAELPLSAAHQETFPVGVALDTGVTSQLPWGENQTLPPMPLIHLLSHHGVLCSFSVINIRPGAPNICTQPEPVADMSGMGMFVAPAPPPVVQPPAVLPQPAVPQQQVPTTVQIKPQPQLQPAPVASMAPPFSTAASIAPTFGSLTTPQTTFGAPASIAAPVPSTPPVASTAPVTAPPGSLLGWTAGSTLFGSGPPPSFGSLSMTPPAPATTSGYMFNMTPTASPADNMARVAPTTGALGGGSFLGGINTTPAVTPSSMFRGLSAAPTTPAVSKPTVSTPMFGLGNNTPPSNFGALNMTTPKAATPVASVTPLAPAPANVVAPPSTPTMQTPVSKPLLSTPKQTPKPDILNTPQPQSQITTPAATNETVTSKKDESAINDQIMQGLIKEEVKNFHSELQELFLRCKTIKLDVGTEDEKTNLVLTTESLLEFQKELQETTDSQVAEVHYLKQALMQSFAWYEDTKARHRRYTDPNFSSLLQAQELDPISEKQLADIKHLIYYIEAQLKQVDGFLDIQWAEFQDSCKKQVKGKLQIPTLEPIYQSLVRQNAFLDRQRYVLKDISARIKSRNKKASAYPNVMNLTSFTNKDPIEIDEELRKLKLDHGDLFAARYEKINAQGNKFTDNKQSKLCSFFTNRNVIHIAPKKPKFINTPSKLSSFTNSPGVQRNLTSTFNKLDSSAVEANLSASNLFSFTLLDGAHSTKIRSPEKSIVSQVPQQVKSANTLQFSTPKSTEVQLKPAAPTSSAPAKIPANLFNLSSATGAAVSSSPVFSFTASSTSVTQSKPVIFGSDDSPSPSLMFSGASNNTKSQPLTKFGLPPQMSTSFAQPKLGEAPAKEAMISKPAEVTLIKPSVQKSSAEPSSIFNGLITSTSEIKPAQTQSFSFINPQPKLATNTAVAKPTAGGIFADSSPLVSSSKPASAASAFGDSSIATPRESIGPGFNFGSALSLGQQSTPKPKTPSAFSIAQMLSQVPTTTTTAVSVSKPVTAIVTSAVTTTAVVTQIVTPKPTFATPPVQAVAPSAPVKSEPVATSVPSSGPSIFGGLAIGKPATPGSFFGQQAMTPPASASGSIFGAIQSTPTPVSGSIFGSKPAQPEDKPTASTVSSPATPTATVSTGFSFTQAAGEPAKPASIFGGAAASTTSANTPTNSSTSGAFSFLQQASSTTSSATSAASAPSTPKIASVFSAATTENKPAEPVTSTVVSTVPAAGFGTGKTTDSFGFGELAAAVSSTTGDNNKFSFGNLTVSALSPSSAPTTSATTSASPNNFSFALTAAAPSTTTTVTTTNASAFGGFGSSVFGGPAAATTTTAASSFLGQPICSPSSFAQPQNTGSMFGQSTGNIFAQKPTTVSVSSGSIFSQQSSGGSLFGGNSNPAVTSASATSIFGQTQSSPFGSAVTATTSATSGGSIFGQSSAFGASATTTSGSIFGQQQQQQQSTFGSPAATSSAGSFSFTQNAAASGFGSSGGSIFGAKPSFTAAPAPAFGQPGAFSAPPAFGGTAAGGSVFGNPASTANPTGNTFGGGFGSPSAFGQKPAFGSPPSFGQSAFGSPPAFGGSPSFGGPQRLFGAATTPPATGAFGAAVQENSTFANLATQPTLGFGTLVQNQPPAQQPQQPQFSGGAQFSSWR